MADVAIGGNLPVGDNNGLAAIASALIAEPAKLRVMLAVIDTQKITTKTDTGEKIATVRVRRIEMVLPQDLGEAEKLLRRSLEHRTGQAVLPLELEGDLEAAFAQVSVDPDAADPEPDTAMDKIDPGPAAPGRRTTDGHFHESGDAHRGWLRHDEHGAHRHTEDGRTEWLAPEDEPPAEEGGPAE